MPQDTAARSQAIEAALCFIVPQDEKPVFHSAAYTGGEPKIFFEIESRNVEIADIRAGASKPTLEKEGFELLAEPTAVEDLNDDDAVRDKYYPEIEALLKKRFGASRVAIFDATRRSDSGDGGASNPDGKRGPATRVHVDYTPKSGPQRLKDTIGVEEAERLLTSDTARVVQVNVWRPIKGPVLRAPLALADASSMAEQDLVATDQVFPNRVGEIYQIAYNPNQRWYYASRMQREEILLIAGWDSADPHSSRCSAHGAFQLPDQDPAAPPRESIEIRTFVIIE
ncbi:MAG: methyltransferase [Gammaproteobacteria bacterium]|nr:methyltransferase [Gammaproteobacteria bacterium]